jgi:glycosyltransferase involved in cell wall biosynthesis
VKITQAVFGVFHNFELGRELDRHGHLDRIYSTWPWARLKSEGLPHSKVETFPWIHTPVTVLERVGLMPRRLSDDLGVWNARLFDDWTYKRIGECDALIALSGAALKTGQLVQRRGGKFCCDIGSSHPRFQDHIVREEYARWGVELPANDLRDTVREEEIFAVADSLTVGSSFAASTYLEAGIPAAKINVIPLGVRLENFRKTLDLPADTFNVLFAGQISLRKGVPYLLEAFAKLRHAKKRLRFAGHVNASIKDVLGRLPLDNVEFLGILPPQQLAETMSRSHVLVLPSVEDGFGMVMAQAMACGCPLICSANTGGPDLITDSVEGFVVPIRDADAIALRLQELADDPARQRAMGDAAERRVHALGGWTDYGDRWEFLLRKLTGAS